MVTVVPSVTAAVAAVTAVAVPSETAAAAAVTAAAVAAIAKPLRQQHQAPFTASKTDSTSTTQNPGFALSPGFTLFGPVLSIFIPI